MGSAVQLRDLLLERVVVSDTESVSVEALTALMSANVEALGQGKAREFQWMERYTVLTAPAVGWLFVRDAESPLSVMLLVGLMLIYWLIALWFQLILNRERRGYYRLMRSIVRIQNLLGFYQSGLLGPHFANSAFPKGFGPIKDVDGTQPFSSFLHRQLYVLVFLIAILFAAVHQCPELAWIAVTLGLADVAYLIVVFVADTAQMRVDTAGEQGLSGWDRSWDYTD
jgi:hypothetical protein